MRTELPVWKTGGLLSTSRMRCAGFSTEPSCMRMVACIRTVPASPARTMTPPEPFCTSRSTGPVTFNVRSNDPVVSSAQTGKESAAKANKSSCPRICMLPPGVHRRAAGTIVSSYHSADGLKLGRGGLGGAPRDQGMEFLHVEVGHRGNVQRQQLGDHQPADHGQAQRLAGFGAGAHPQGDGKSAE